jgi:hypothetical protein
MKKQREGTERRRKRTGATGDEKDGVEVLSRLGGAVRSLESDQTLDLVTAPRCKTFLDVLGEVLRQTAVNSQEEADLLRVLRVGLDGDVRGRERVRLPV